MNDKMGNLNFTEKISDALSFEMIHVEGGEFRMGGTDDNAAKREKPVHKVIVPPFYLGKYPVTEELWDLVMKREDQKLVVSSFRPKAKISWHDAQAFLKKLNQITGKLYRLPSESEWEYAVRGGRRNMGFLYAGSDKLKEVGWYDENSEATAHPVGQLLGNELGLHDMSGNVWEWCEDDWHDDYEGAPSGGSAWIDEPARGAKRVLRGGSWSYGARYCRVSYRRRLEPDVRHDDAGFRLCLSSPG